GRGGPSRIRTGDTGFRRAGPRPPSYEAFGGQGWRRTGGGAAPPGKAEARAGRARALSTLSPIRLSSLARDMSHIRRCAPARAVRRGGRHVRSASRDTVVTWESVRACGRGREERSVVTLGGSYRHVRLWTL